MRIGLVSDTHAGSDPRPVAGPLSAALGALGVSLILHMGDVGHPGVLDILEGVAPTLAVRDFTEPASGDPRLGSIVRVVEAAGVRIGMVHDLGWPGPRIVADLRVSLPGDPPLPEVLRRRFGQEVEVVAFGHSHQEVVEVVGGVLFVNPGSAAYPARPRGPGYQGTLGLLEVTGAGSVSARVMRVRDVPASGL